MAVSRARYFFFFSLPFNGTNGFIERRLTAERARAEPVYSENARAFALRGLSSSLDEDRYDLVRNCNGDIATTRKTKTISPCVSKIEKDVSEYRISGFYHALPSRGSTARGGSRYTYTRISRQFAPIRRETILLDSGRSSRVFASREKVPPAYSAKRSRRGVHSPSFGPIPFIEMEIYRVADAAIRARDHAVLVVIRRELHLAVASILTYITRAFRERKKKKKG